MSKFLVGVAVAVLAVWSVPPLRDAVLDAASIATERFDRRPARVILLIGNSRTSFNGMDETLRRIADSAASPQRFAITMRALPGGSLQDSWNDSETRRLLKDRWTDIVIQPESRAHGAPDRQALFFEFGGRLIGEAAASGVVPTVIVNWTYGEQLFRDDPAGRASYDDQIQSDCRVLSQRTGARLVNTGKVWEKVHAAAPDLSLYEDGNHPRPQGSYLSALVLYARLARREVSDVSYRPAGVTTEQARIIKDQVSEALRSGLI